MVKKIIALIFCFAFLAGAAYCDDSFNPGDYGIDINPGDVEGGIKDPKTKEKVTSDIPDVLKKALEDEWKAFLPIPWPAKESTQKDVNKQLQNLLTQLGLIDAEQIGINAILKKQIEKGEEMKEILKAESETFGKSILGVNNGVGMAANAISELIKQYYDSKALLKKLGDLDKDFTKVFFNISYYPTGPWINNYSGQYAKMNEAMEKRFSDIKSEYFYDLKIEAEDLKYDWMSPLNPLNKHSSVLLPRISSMLQKPDGRNKILQGFNELLTFVGGQFLDIRAMMTEQLSDYLAYTRRERSARMAHTAVMEQDMMTWQNYIETVSADTAKKEKDNKTVRYTGMLRYDSERNKK